MTINPSLPFSQLNYRHKQSRKLRHVMTVSTIAMASFLAVPAYGQVLPAGCIPGTAVAGETVQCSGVIDGTIFTNVDDLTIVVGDDGNAATVNGGAQGISMSGSDLTLNVVNSGSNVNGTVDGAFIFASGGDVNVNSEGTISGNDRAGLVVLHNGAGSVNINTHDTLGLGTSPYIGEGIYVFNGSGGSDVNITSTGLSQGSRNGLQVRNYGSGDVVINANDTTGVYGSGISVRNGSTAGNINVVSAGTASGDYNGIVAVNNGTGSTNISVNNAYGGTAPNGVGIAVGTGGATSDINISATGTVSGYFEGIAVRNNGSGALNIDVADVTATALDRGDGINVYNEGSDINISSSGEITGARNGIYVYNEGFGPTTINVNDVTSTSAHGVFVNDYHGNDVNISSTGEINAGRAGIFAVTYGGNININAHDVTGGQADSSGYGGYSDGINADTFNFYGALGDVNINVTGDVYGSDDGIIARNDGGAINVSAHNVTAGNSDGVILSGSGTDISLNVSGDISAVANGVRSRNRGTGSTTISVNNVESSNSIAIYVYGGASSTDMTITTTGNVSGQTGIQAVNNGGGDTMISVSGIVEGGTGAAIDTSTTAGATTNIELLDGAHVSSASGIAISNDEGDSNILIDHGATVIGEISLGDGSDTLTIMGEANVSGVTLFDGGDDESDADGFVDTLRLDGAVIDISSDNIVNFEDIVIIDSDATLTDFVWDDVNVCGGSTTLTGASAVDNVLGCVFDDTVIATGDTVIAEAIEGAGGADIIMVSGNASAAGGVFGGEAGNDDSAALDDGDMITIETTGTVALIDGGAGGDMIMLNAGNITGDVLGGVGDDIVGFSGADVSGIIDLGTDNDALNYNVDKDIPLIIGGDGTDTVNFNIQGDLFDDIGAANGNLSQFEVYNFNTGGWTVNDLSALEEVNFLTGENTLTGNIDSVMTMIGDGVLLTAMDGSSVSGDLINNGDLSIADTGIGTLTVGGNFTQTSSGSTIMDVNGPSNHDQIIVGGSANLGGNLTVNQSQFFLGTATLIDAGSLNGTFNTHNVMGTGLLLSNELEYDTANGDVNIIGTRADASSVAGLTSNQIAVGNALVDDFIGGMTSDDLGALALATGALSDVGNLSSTLEELHPEELIAGVEIFRNSQMIFANSLMIHSGVSQEVAPTLLASNSGPMIDDDGLTDDHVWAAFQYMHSEQDGTQSGVDYESDGYDLTLGVSNLGNGSVRFGAAVSYGVMDSEIGGLGTDKVDSKMFRVGGHIRNDLNRSARGLRGHVDVVGSLGIGSNEIERNVTASAVSLAEIQTADPDIDGYNAYMRFTMDGANGRDWMVRPFVQGGFDGVKQDAVSFGSSAAALTTEEIDATRTTLGGGATFETTLGSNGYISLAGTGLFHQGDTDSAFTSRFNNTGSTGASFVTVGEDVKEQYIIDLSMGKLAKTGGLVFGLDGFVELGDLEGYGGRVRIGQRF